MSEQHTCMYCHGELEEQLVTRVQEYQGHWVVIENVPALVCSQCGEQFFTPAAHDLIIAILKGNRSPVRVETIQVFDAAS